MAKIVKLVLSMMVTMIIPISFLINSCSFFSSPCDSNSISLLARAYALSFDYFNPSTFTSFVNNYSGEFAKNGKVTSCAADFSEKLFAYEAGQYSNDKALNDSVNSLEMQYGLSPSSHGNNGGQIMLLAQEICWLSTVFPSVADGDYSSYNNTGTPMRKMNKDYMLNLSPAMEAIGLGNFQRNLAKNMQPLNEEVIISLGHLFYK